MTLSLGSLLGLLGLSFILTLGLGIYTWNRRTMPGARPFALSMFAAALWATGYGFELALPDLPGKLFWANLQYLSYTSIPVLWLLLCLQFSGNDRWNRPPRLALLLIIPAITLLLIWTNEWHGLMRRDVHLDTSGPVAVIGRTYGPWAYVHIVYSYVLFVISALVLIRVQAAGMPVFRGQPMILLAGLLVPLVANVLFVTGLGTNRQYDFSPVMMGISGMLIAWGLFHYQMFDLLPYARDAMLMSIREGVILLDASGRVAVVNQMAQQLLQKPADQLKGRPACEVFKDWPQLLRLLSEPETTRVDLTLSSIDQQRYFDLTLSPLIDPYGRLVGELVLLHDITRRIQVEDELRALSVTDPLTGLYNRRKFFDQLEIEIERAHRHNLPLSVLMIDVDGLKEINDTLGHVVGDEVLRQMGRILSQSRRPDVPARYGGDEFVLLLPSTGLEGAQHTARRLLKEAARAPLPHGAQLRISIGIADLRSGDNRDGNDMLERADQAMYRAKASRAGLAIAAEDSETLPDKGG